MVVCISAIYEDIIYYHLTGQVFKKLFYGLLIYFATGSDAMGHVYVSVTAEYGIECVITTELLIERNMPECTLSIENAEHGYMGY